MRSWLLIVHAIAFAGITQAASTTSDPQLYGIHGIDLQVQVIDIHRIHDRSVDVELQKAGRAVVERHGLELTGGPKQYLFVTIRLSKVDPEICDADLVVIESQVEFTDDLTFNRDPKIRSSDSIVTWRSSDADVVRRSDLDFWLRSRVVSGIEGFIRRMPR